LATYRIFPTTNGPAGPISYSGEFIAGVCFTVTKGGCWLQGFWWWVCASGQSTGPTKMCLWSVTTPGNGVVVPGTTVTSGSLTAGAWNYVALPTPVQLGLGGTYVAAIGVNGGPFPDTNGFWASGAIVNGPLVAFGQQTQNAENWWPQQNVAPYNVPQGCFTTGGSAADPTTAFPGGTSGTDNFWVDVQISDTAPAGNWSYRLWPNRYDQGQFTGADSEVAYTVATEVILSQACHLNKIWYVSPSGGNPAPTMATEATVWDVATQTAVADFVDPAWMSIIGGGGSPGYGWCYVDVTSANIVLPAGRYKVSVYNSNTSSSDGGAGQWSAKYLYYWGADATAGTSGVLGGGEAPNGIASGPLFAPSPTSAPAASNCYVFNGEEAGTPPWSNGSQMAGQSSFAMPPGNGYPSLYVTDGIPSGNDAFTQNYWVDMEVTPVLSPALRSGSFLTFFS
jgi:hypothetical protein